MEFDPTEIKGAFLHEWREPESGLTCVVVWILICYGRNFGFQSHAHSHCL